MQIPESRKNPDVPPVGKNQRDRWLAAVGVAAAVAGIGVYVIVTKKRPGAEVAELAHAVRKSAGGLVSGHPKMQAYGPQWSLHRPIEIGPYFRGAAAAA